MRGVAGALRALRKYRVSRSYIRPAIFVMPQELATKLMIIEKPDHMDESDFREIAHALEILTNPSP